LRRRRRRRRQGDQNPSGLKYFDTQVGTGAEAKKGDTVTVHYTGKLRSGKQFDSSLERKEPFKFTLSARKAIKGFDEGITGMKVGGKRKLYIPSDLAYGKRGSEPAIPPDSDWCSTWNCSTWSRGRMSRRTLPSSRAKT